MRARRMLDPSFEVRMAPVLLPWLYLLLTGAIAIGAVGSIAVAFWFAWWTGLVALVLVPIAALLVFVLVRVVCEMILDFCRMPAEIRQMAAGLERVENTVDGVATDMPRIAFLRGPKRPSA